MERLGDWRRRHVCGDVRPEHVRQTVTLMGGVHRRRDHGGLLFIDLGDRAGLAQRVFNPDADAAAHASRTGTSTCGGTTSPPATILGRFRVELARRLALLAGVDSIREVIAFPKTKQGVDPLTEAPAPASPAQLRELGIVMIDSDRTT